MSFDHSSSTARPGASPTPSPSPGRGRNRGRGRPGRPTDTAAVHPLAAPPATTSATDTSFDQLGVSARLVEVLAAQGFTTSFPIQAATLPDSLAGRDLLGRGRTGSGKTVAFALPVVTRLAKRAERGAAYRPRGLVLVPTRELALQVEAVIAPLAKVLGLRTTTVFGGVSQQRQVNALRGGVDIVIACPGRLEDLIDQRFCDLGHVEITVLDEADHLADLGFLPAVRRLLDRTPKDGQRLLFSATLDNGVDVIARRYLSNPVVHAVDPESSPISTMEHHVLYVSATDKASVIAGLAGGRGRTLLFTRTKHGARKLATQLTRSGIPATELHGNLTQPARERNLAAFAGDGLRVLVATDIAARGIHVDDIGLVIHVDPPADHKAYLHRSGRTARAGADGTVVVLATPDQRGEVADLARRAGVRPQITPVTDGHPTIAQLAGPPAARVDADANLSPAARTSVRSPRPEGVTAQPRRGSGSGTGSGGNRNGRGAATAPARRSGHAGSPRRRAY